MKPMNRVLVSLGALAALAMLGLPALAGQTLDNGRLTVTAQPGSPVVVTSKGAGGPTARFELALCGAGSGAAAVDKVEGKGPETLRLGGGGVEVDLTLGKRQPYLTVTPARAGGFLEVRTAARYAILPDFFGYDLVYDPGRFKGDRVLAPAENLLMNLLDGGKAMVMCTWGGAGGGGKDAGAGGAAKPAERDPIVELALSGAGDARRVAAARIELLGGPVHVALLERDNLWHEESVGGLKPLNPNEIAWKRSFEAKWRVDMLVAEGKKSANLMTRSVSYEFLYAPEGDPRAAWSKAQAGDDKVRASVIMYQWTEGVPRIEEETVNRHIYPAWFNKEKTFLAPYADNPHKIKGKEAQTENIFDRAVIYPIDRQEKTPVEVLTPVDIMRETLGQGPCEYVLDLEGLQSRRTSGQEDYKLVDVATCTIWLRHIFPIISAKSKELPEDKKAYLARAVGDLPICVHAVCKRLEEYDQWTRDFSAWLDKNPANGEAKPAADRVRELLGGMQAMIKKYDPAKFKSEGEAWDAKVAEAVKAVQAGNIAEVEKVGGIRELAQKQDNAVSDCRRFVKAIREEVSYVEGSSAEAQKFVTGVREQCRQILRRGHPKEMLHSDPRTYER